MTDRLTKRELRVRSDRVARIASLRDLRLREIEAKVLDPTAKARFEPKVSLEPIAGTIGEFAIYDLGYRLSATDSREKEVFVARLALSLVFRLDQSSDVGQEEIEAFGAIGVVEIAHPYVRELVHSLTLRMGLPPFVLDVAPPI